MNNIKIISTLLEKDNSESKKEVYLGDFASSLDSYKKNKILSNNEIFKENRKKLFNLNKKIINVFYKEYKHFYNSKISKKSFSLVVSPFIFTFLDIIKNKYNCISSCKKKIKFSKFSILDESYFVYPENFSEFLSKIQSDKFNLQLNSEVIKFKKYKCNKVKINNSLKYKIFQLFKKKKLSK